jgi:hypothetical protein
MGTTSQGPATGQFLRYGQLVVSSSTPTTTTTSLGATSLGQVDGMTTFSTGVAETQNNSFRIDETPNTLTVRVYNISASTLNKILGNNGAEYDTVTLTAGYQNGNKGNRLIGEIKQYRYGRERNVDSYLDILAADGDIAYINQSFPAGTTDSQELSAYAKSMGIPVATGADPFLSTGGIIPDPRGKVAFGMTRIYMAKLAKTNNCRWSIQNGVVTLVPVTGYLPGQAVKINSSSGMIGTPEQTDAGIVIRCYLNPLIKIGQLVQINNADINQAVIKSQFFPSYTSQYYPATTTNDGFYRVLVAEHVGDTRGNDWYTELTCLDVDPSSPASTSVFAAG